MLPPRLNSCRDQLNSLEAPGARSKPRVNVELRRPLAILRSSMTAVAGTYEVGRFTDDHQVILVVVQEAASILGGIHYDLRAASSD